MGQNSSLLLTRIPSEVLTDIAVLGVDQLGPPKQLLACLLVCKQLTFRLEVEAICARIFRCNFDLSAPERRLPESAVYPRNLYEQLQTYCKTLKVIRSGNIYHPDLVEHLWNAYFMLTENDGRNGQQLIRWAGLRTFIDDLVRTRLHEGKEANHNWPCETDLNSLALWVMWLSLDYDAIRAEDEDQRARMMELVRPYVVNYARYPVYHVPDNHFHIPIDRMYMGQFPFYVSTAHGPYPPYRDALTVSVTRTHFTIPLNMMPPPISIAARLLYFSRSESTPIAVTDDVPANRAVAIANGQNWVRPTRVDITELNAQEAARPLVPFGEDPDDLLSIQYDHCFQRLLDCRDPFNSVTLAPYTIGTLTGDFAGRMLVPDASQNADMLNTEDFEAGVPNMSIAPLYARLVEWQCVNPQKPVPEGGEGSRLWDEGIRNGWFPEVIFYIEGDVLRIAHRYTGSIMYCYERFVPGRPNSHSPETCTSCQARVAMEERMEVERAQRTSRMCQRGGEEGGDGNDDGKDDEVDEAPPSSSTIHTPIIPENLPRPEDPLDPRFVRAEIQGALGNDVNLDRIISSEMDAADAANEEDMEMDTDEETVPENEPEDDYSPFEQESCAGIRDIIITGETIQRHAEAWHNYVYYGRVRKFDGLIALVRKPVSFPGLGVQIFRGYVVGGRSLVGNWRAFRMNPNDLAQEGPFIATRTNFNT